MRWTTMRRSSNVEDLRGRGFGLRMGGRPLIAGGGIGGLILLLLFVMFGGNPLALLDGGDGTVTQTQRGTAAGDEQSQFVAAVLGDTEDVWSKLFRKMGREYREPHLVLFEGRAESACGLSSSATGPFYCPADERVYIDLSFYDELATRFRAPGDFAQAYVIAHEVGHHVQRLLGTTQRVHSQRSRLSEAEYNALSVRLELQADFFAGVWAHHAQAARSVLEKGDIEEGLAAAAAIGDDRLQRRARGYVVPDSFTHGTSEQRVRWFRKGLEIGDPAAGDTFSIDRP